MGISLLESFFNFGKEEQSFHGIFNGSVAGKRLDGFENFLFSCHNEKDSSVAVMVQYYHRLFDERN